MHKKRLVIFGLLFAFLGSVYVYKKRLSPYPSLIPEVLSIPLDWRIQDDALVKLERIAKTLYYIEATYVDPERVKPQTMFEKALKGLAQSIPEVQVLFPNNYKTVVLVNQQRREFDLRVMNLHSLHTSLSEVLRFVRDQKVSDLKDEDLESLALSSILETLDPHSVYLPKEHYKETLVGTSGEFGGLGIVIGFRDKKLTIISPIDGTPASKAGLKSGDHITKIGDESTHNMLLTEAVSRMRGKKGSKVTISVLREGWEAHKPFELTRDHIKVVSVESLLLPEDIAYIRIKNFQQDTGQSLSKHLKALRKKTKDGIQGAVLDLRGNPGGILDQAIAVSNTFISDGVIVSTVGYRNNFNKKERASKSGTEPTYPLTILVDEGSASASEIVAGALKKDRALIIGTQTFGKGTVQRLFDLPEESALKLTIAKYLTPGDVSIQSIGITPDILTRSAIIGPKAYNLFPNSNKYSEATLEGHFNNPEDQTVIKTPKDKPSYNLTFLQKLDEDGFSTTQLSLGDNEKERRKKILGDPQVDLARKIIANSSNAKRNSLIEASKSVVDSFDQKQLKIIQAALKEKNIDWSSGPKAKKCKKAPKMATRIESQSTSKLTPGDKVKLKVQLENNTACTFSRSWVEAESKQYFFNHHEFIFGKLSPGEKVSRTVDVEIPKGATEGLAQIDFSLRAQGQEKAISTNELRTPIQKGSEPLFQYTVKIEDKNKNQMIESGEDFYFLIDLKNVGHTSSDQTSISIKPDDSSKVKMIKGHVPLDAVKSNETKQVKLHAKALSKKMGEDLEFTLNINDFEYRIFQSNPLQVKLGEKQGMTTAGFSPPRINLKMASKLYTPASKKFFSIEGRLSDDDAIKDLFILVNDKKVHYKHFDEARPSKNQDFSTSVPLDPGENRIVVVARDSQDMVKSERFVIQRQEN